MTGIRIISAAVATALFSAVGGGVAAEFPELVPLEQTLRDGGGWYLRLDAGYSLDSDGDGSISIHDPDFDGPDAIGYDMLRLGWKHDLAIGAGYRFTDHLRADVTLGHWSRDVDGTARYSGINQWTYRESASLDVWEALVNAYVDIARVGRFTPYAGAGLGVARVDYGTLTNAATCACGVTFTGEQPGLSSTRLTWALMAGTAIDLTPSIKLDVGYRFSRLEGGRAFGWDQYDTAAGLKGTQISDDGYNTHQLRVGLRKSFP